jgi:peptidyl-prolyl cis-trans isomerase C
VRKDIVIAIIAVLGVLVVSFGLAKARPDLPATPSQPHVATKGGSTQAKAGKVIMHVNGEPVTEAEFNSFLQAVPEQQRTFFALPQGRRELANEIVRMKALEQEARRLGMDKDPELVTQLELLRTQFTATRALQKIAAQRAEKEIPAAYEREKKNALTLRHIVFSYEGGMVPTRDQSNPPNEAGAMEKAKGVVARLRAGADFATTARSESDDAESAARGGSLGPMQPQMLPPDIAAVVSKLKPGQYSDPVKTQFGVHIFNVTEPTLEELKPSLMQQVQSQIAQEEVNRLQKAAKVELDPQFFPQPPSTPMQKRPQG